MPKTNTTLKSRARRKPVVLTAQDRRRGVDGLRYEARLAYLDGRNARSRDLNRKVALLTREQIAVQSAQTKLRAALRDAGSALAVIERQGA